MKSIENLHKGSGVPQKDSGKSACGTLFSAKVISPAYPQNCNDFVTIVSKKTQKENKEKQTL